MNSKITLGLALVFAAAAFARPGFDDRRAGDDWGRHDRPVAHWKHERWERERLERERCERERIEREQREWQRLEAYRIEQERIRIALERDRIRREAERDRCRRDHDRREAMREPERPSRTIHTEDQRQERPRISIGVVWHQVLQ